MEDSLIVLYEDNKLIIQTTGVVSKGKLLVIDRDKPEISLLTHRLTNTDFIQIPANLPGGRYQVQILSANKKMTKNITIKINQR